MNVYTIRLRIYLCWWFIAQKCFFEWVQLSWVHDFAWDFCLFRKGNFVWAVQSFNAIRQPLQELSGENVGSTWSLGKHTWPSWLAHSKRAKSSQSQSLCSSNDLFLHFASIKQTTCSNPNWIKVIYLTAPFLWQLHLNTMTVT